MKRFPKCVVAVILIVGLGVLLTPLVEAKQDGRHKVGRAEDYEPAIDPPDFEDSNGDPLPVDNLFWPLVRGTTFTYEDEDGEEHNEVYVTHFTRDILGVTCTEVLDREWEQEDGELVLVEETYDWYAQDKWGNVWYFGEDSTTFEDGEPVGGEGSCEAGVDGARPGILMLAKPQPGESYRQEYYEGVAEDMARVLRLNASVAVEHGDFDECLVTKEWTPLEPGEVEHKYYAPGVGLVVIEELKGGKTRFELLEITTE